MKKSALRRTTGEGTHMADSPSNSSTRVRPDRGSPPSTPLWVKVFVIFLIALVLLFVIMRVIGSIHGGHMSAIEYGVQQLWS
jgi:hypothetical protein